jgi:hypothetical protein
MLFGTQSQRLHNPRIRLAALPELLQGEAVVVVLVHLVEDLVDSLLGRVLVLGRLLALQRTKSEQTFSAARYLPPSGRWRPRCCTSRLAL